MLILRQGSMRVSTDKRHNGQLIPSMESSAHYLNADPGGSLRSKCLLENWEGARAIFEVS